MSMIAEGVHIRVSCKPAREVKTRKMPNEMKAGIFNPVLNVLFAKEKSRRFFC
jgi:hypothetical protein